MSGSIFHPVIDALAFHEWNTVADLTPYMSEGWRERLTHPEEHGGPPELRSASLYSNPAGDKAPNTYPPTGRPGSDLATFQKQLLDTGKRDRIVLGFDEGMLASANTNHYLARVAVQAANDWTIDNWLDRDERLYGLILVSAALPDKAVEEIHRLGTNERMVGVAFGANALSQPLGHPVYHPIYKAAAELGLPVVLQAGCDSPANLLTLPVAGGLPATYAEYKAMAAQPLMSHVGNIILQGVFELFPDLKLLVVGAGASWIPGLLWRQDYYFKIESDGAPWLKRSPTEYFRRHVRVATYPLESPRDPARVAAALSTVPWLDEVLLYASGYPSYDWQEPETILPKIPERWRERVLRQNAEEFFRWPARVPTSGAGRKVTKV